MENNKKYRGLSQEFISAWNKSELKDFYEKHKEELYIGIRVGYINLYYKGASISKIKYSSKTKKFHYEIANRYLDIDNKKGRQQITLDDLKYNYEKIKENVSIIQTDEKIAQQLIAQYINENNFEWQCIDIEYEKKNQSGRFGRFDIIAVTRQKPYKTALIELKYGSKAIGGSNGICKHAEDFLLFVGENNDLKEELCSVMNSYRSLVSSSHPEVSVEDFNNNADIYFMILANNLDDNLVNQTKRYLLDYVAGASTKSFQKLITDKKYEDKLKNFDPIFLFSDVCLTNNRNELNIDDLTGFDRYKLMKSSNRLEDLKKF